MPILPVLALGIFVACQLGLLLVAGVRMRQLWLARKPAPPPRRCSPAQGSWPVVTVQLPIHNERCVVERLMRSVADLDYPRDRLEIQVLDDSTDDTTGIARAMARGLSAEGVSVEVLHRSDRTGFKAGALAGGMARSRGSLIAIFDADFLPPPDFLRRAVPAFADPRVGMVQARWGHLNEPYSLLTRLQAALLDAHFLVEHRARLRAGALFNFNGTAGVWRREAIEASGGWQHDTLTEDLDLSYRAQLCGWQFGYLEDLVAPAELPVDVNAFKGQQYRWARGSLQTARKLLGEVWRSPLPLGVKLEAAFHLAGNLAYGLALLPAMLMLPLMWLPDRFSGPLPLVLAAFLFVPTVALLVFFSGVYLLRGTRARSWEIPALLMLGIGLSLNNTRAAIRGLFGSTGTFRRTPKSSVQGRNRPAGVGAYQAVPDRWALLELALAGYFLWGAGQAWEMRRLETLPFLVLFAAGFAYVGGLSVWGELRSRFPVRLAEGAG